MIVNHLETFEVISQIDRALFESVQGRDQPFSAAVNTSLGPDKTSLFHTALKSRLPTLFPARGY